MVEMRWIFCDLSKGGPPIGSVCVGERIYQKLQYRTLIPNLSNDGRLLSDYWSPWRDIPCAGFEDSQVI